MDEHILEINLKIVFIDRGEGVTQVESSHTVKGEATNHGFRQAILGGIGALMNIYEKQAKDIVIHTKNY